jgi:hypothetical protein
MQTLQNVPVCAPFVKKGFVVFTLKGGDYTSQKTAQTPVSKRQE